MLKKSGLADGYIHGFSADEQDRLYQQARVHEENIFSQIDFSGQSNIVEVGSGVGAQTQILLERFPHLKISTFIFAAVIARSSRFFLLAYAVKSFGPKFANQFRTYFVMFIVSVIVICLLGLGVIGWSQLSGAARSCQNSSSTMSWSGFRLAACSRSFRRRSNRWVSPA